mmetsp:Transcript_48514/g.48877  ORF Transcript_48514/g.48877 Transcript_48514/m.48877 type:complete len:219 (-) Transcript_48514:456-1112(-)
MGQAMRMMKYDRAGNIANSIDALSFDGYPLNWHRLDDGVMGGKSETLQDLLMTPTSEGESMLRFSGTINTEGGGFASIRAPLSETGLTKETTALRIKYRGDGRTYKVLLSNGNQSTGGPWSKNPSWQIDLPTSSNGVTSTSLPLSKFLPSFGARAASDTDNFTLIPSEMHEIGLMLSLKLSDGSDNPVSTFGEGIFDFCLDIDSVDPVTSKEGEQKEL